MRPDAVVDEGVSVGDLDVNVVEGIDAIVDEGVNVDDLDVNVVEGIDAVVDEGVNVDDLDVNVVEGIDAVFDEGVSVDEGVKDGKPGSVGVKGGSDRMWEWGWVYRRTVPSGKHNPNESMAAMAWCWER